ncbi:MAG: electron transfer flavoprotein subunit beta/FixA family protein [Bacilli bacterium]|nr:electron transfer flavoprotein subunit beta/FixA family protein [Bacilli bacterium]
MNIIVCIKQVPASSNVKIDPVTGVLIRDGKNTKMNPYDLYALETALKIKDSLGATVKTITMGPPPAIQVLQESLWMGCDDATIISDRKFGGADVVATSYTIAQGVKTLGDFDLIICGKQTTDGDTAQVGPEMANVLGIPHVCYVDKILEVKEKSIVVRTNLDKTYEILEVKYPCLITVDKGIYTPRLPSYKRSVKFKDYNVHTITFADVKDQDETHYGLKGSPTQVEKMFNPDRNTNKVILKGNTEELTDQLFTVLKDNKYLGE